jgi:hypothetical protein
MKKIIVDIDNTLWDFAPVLYGRIKEINPAITPPTEWLVWDFWRPYLSSHQLYTIIRDIHMEQDSYPVYPDAASFLASVKDLDLHIIIASHREKGTLEATTRWLVKHSLLFDEVHLSHDKSVLFDDSWAIIDDSPATLQKAAEFGIVRAGLRTPWNRHDNHPLFDNLMEVLDYIRGVISQEESGTA